MTVERRAVTKDESWDAQTVETMVSSLAGYLAPKLGDSMVVKTVATRNDTRAAKTVVMTVELMVPLTVVWMADLMVLMKVLESAQRKVDSMVAKTDSRMAVLKVVMMVDKTVA